MHMKSWKVFSAAVCGNQINSNPSTKADIQTLSVLKVHLDLLEGNRYGNSTFRCKISESRTTFLPADVARLSTEPTWKFNSKPPYDTNLRTQKDRLLSYPSSFNTRYMYAESWKAHVLEGRVTRWRMLCKCLSRCLTLSYLLAKAPSPKARPPKAPANQTIVNFLLRRRFSFT